MEAINNPNQLEELNAVVNFYRYFLRCEEYDSVVENYVYRRLMTEVNKQGRYMQEEERLVWIRRLLDFVKS